MSTRCYIGVEKEDKSVEYIYCHHDGYPAGVGKTLVENYTSPESIQKLMALGDLSSLGPEPVDNPESWNHTWCLYDECENDRRCVSYKGRGDTDCDAHEADNLEEFCEYFQNSDVDFVYINREGKWYLIGYNPKSKEITLKNIYYKKR